MKRLLIIAFSLCLTALQAAEHKHINLSVIDMYEQTDTMSEVVSQAIYGTPVKVTKEEGDWSYIQTPDTYEGWVPSNALFSNDQPSTLPIKWMARVKILWTHLCYVPDTTPHPPALTLPYGAKIEVVSTAEEIQNRWIRVRLLDGKVVYAQSADFDFSEAPLNLEEMLLEATQFIGLPYRWGGTSSFGFDCSGLVQTLFLQKGIILPRNSSMQAAASKQITREQLQRGDLVFFGRNKERITHVGIYLGNDRFLHAVTTNKSGPHVIQISSLGDSEWSDIYISSGRVQ